MALAVAVCLLGQGLGVVRAADPVAAPAAGSEAALADMISASRLALQDGLYPLVERQLSAAVQQFTRSTDRDQMAAILGLLLRAQFEQGKYDEMLVTLRNVRSWVKRMEENGFSEYWNAMALYGQGQYAESLDLLKSMEEEKPGAELMARGLRLRAWCLLSARRPQEALQAFAAYDAAYGKSAEAPANLLDWAKALVGLGRRGEAETLLVRLATRGGRDRATLEGLLLLGSLRLERNDIAGVQEAAAAVADATAAPPDLMAKAYYLLSDAIPSKGTAEEMERALDMIEAGIALAESRPLKQKGFLKLGMRLLDGGEIERGVETIKRSIGQLEGDPLAEAAQLKLAAALLDRGKHEDALKEFQSYVETFTNRVGLAEAYYGMAWGLLDLGRNAEASGSFRKAYELSEARERREQCLFKEGDADFLNAQYRKAVEVYEEFLREFPDSARRANVEFQLGESLFRAEDYERAESVLAAVAQKMPASPLAEEALLQIAEIRQVRGDWAGAEQQYERLIQNTTNAVFAGETLHGRGLCRFQLFRFREALEDFGRIVAEYPGTRMAEQAFYLRGLCSFYLLQDDQALTTLKEFLQKYPDSQWAADVQFWLARYDYNNGDYERAEDEFIQFQARYPRHPLADNALFRAGSSAARRKEYVRAIELLTKLTQEYPKSPKLWDARFAQADALCVLGRSIEAILILEELIASCPDTHLVSLAWLRKGDSQFILGADAAPRYQEALESYRVVSAARDLQEDLVLEAEFKIGRCLDKMGRTDEALDQYYVRVIARFFRDRDKGLWQSESVRLWFSRASREAAAILESRQDWRGLVKVLQRIVDAGVEGSQDARERIAKIRSERWWLFY